MTRAAKEFIADDLAALHQSSGASGGLGGLAAVAGRRPSATEERSVMRMTEGNEEQRATEGERLE